MSNKIAGFFTLGCMAGMFEAVAKVLIHGLPRGIIEMFLYLAASGVTYGILFALISMLFFGRRGIEAALGACAAIFLLVQLAVYYLWNHYWITPLYGGKGGIIYKGAALAGVLVAGWIVFVLGRSLNAASRISGQRSRIKSRIIYIGLMLTLLSMLLVWGLPLLDKEETKQGDNIVFITIDTLRADALACYGSPVVSTPEIDGMVGQGIVFSDVVCEMPLTTPSHAAIFSSTYPATNKALGNSYVFQKGFPTLFQMFNRYMGYRCAAFISGFPLDARFGLNRGCHVYDDRFFRHDGIYRVSLLQLMMRLTSGNRIERIAEETTDTALEWLKANQDKNFFLWMHYFDPHAPYEPPPPFDSMYRGKLPERPARTDAEKESIMRAMGPHWSREGNTDNLNVPVEGYFGEISYVDRELGRLFDFLRERGLWDDAFIILTSDHGESLTEHDYLFQHGEYLYEPSVRVPLIFKLAGSEKAGLKIQRSVGLIDIAPTILDCFELAPPRTFQGQSLLPFIRQEAEDVLEMPAFIENTDRTPFYRPKKLRAVRAWGWKYIFSPEDQAVELYNLRDDPEEMNNLAGLDNTMDGYLRAYMDQWEAVTGDRAGEAGEMLIDEETGEKLKELGYVTR